VFDQLSAVARWAVTRIAAVEKFGAKIALQTGEPSVQGRVIKLKLARAAAVSLTTRATARNDCNRKTFNMQFCTRPT
jgi:hypothetical protein